MARKLLTDNTIKNLKPAAAGKRYFVHDTLVPPFGVRVTGNGSKSYIIAARIAGSKDTTRPSLGKVGSISLAAAREKAKRWLTLIEAGEDPRESELQDAEAKAKDRQTTFRAVAERFIKEWLPGQRKAKVVEREIRRELIGFWGDKPIKALQPDDVITRMDAIRLRGRGTGAYARNVYGHVQRIFIWALPRGYGLTHSPCDRLRPKDMKLTKRSRERVLDDFELFALWRAASRTPQPYGPLVQLIMLTGARLGEVGRAEWREFDLDRDKLWTVPPARFKTNTTHLVPLTADMLALLSEIDEWDECDFVFSFDGERCFNGYSKSKLRLDQRMALAWRAARRVRGLRWKNEELPNWTLHDIRRTVRTRMSELKIDDKIAEHVIGHARVGIQGVYDRHRYVAEMRDALEKWNALLARIVKAPPGGNVVQLPAGEGRSADAV
ncbi:MAG: tyrosine-type recombinase/integrase [Alphaproteobacteria bacterium]